MRNKLIVLLSVVLMAGALAGSWARAKSGKARVWVDVTQQSPNIFTTAEECPKDHPAQLWVLPEDHKSNSHLIRICGQYNAKHEVMVSDEDGHIVNP
jgi:hypothetical protein